MTIENLSGDYTEVDIPADRIKNITSNSCRLYDLQGLSDVYLYKDFGADFFDGDFEHWMEMYVESASSWPNTGCYGIANTTASQDDIDAAGGDYISVRIRRGSPYFKLYVCTNGSLVTSSDTASITQDTWYWFELERKDSVGTYGTMYLRIYSDAAKETLVTSVSRTITVEKTDFQYHMPVFGVNNGLTTSYRGYQKDFDLNIPEPAADPVGAFTPSLQFNRRKKVA